MKLFWALLVGAASLLAEDTLTTGQAARLVIGQRTFTAQESGASSALLGAAGGLAYANDMLVVADSNRVGASPINHRVLLYKNLSSDLPAPAAELPVSDNPCPVCTGTADVVLGQPDFESTQLKPASATTLRSPLAAATDGTILAVADTDNNRVLIWNSIPTTNAQAANIVVGQPDFQRTVPNDGQGNVPTAKSLRGPQGVWIQDGRLLVADTGNNRVLIWNRIPASNGQQADLVLGVKDFSTFVSSELSQQRLVASADALLTPVSVTSDGTRIYVSDLGYNRVLIWNSFPTRNQQPADVVVGQPDMESRVSNNVTKLCEPTGESGTGEKLYPNLCGATVNFPRFALSDGKYFFIADGGNDRILVYNRVPTQNGAKADAVLGQIEENLNLISENFDPGGISGAGAIRTPQSLAWDGTNLYASDPYNRRVLVFTPAERKIPNTGVRNTASRDVFAVGAVTLTGKVKENDELTVKIQDREYKYKANKNDSLNSVVLNMIATINSGEGDPAVFASPNVIASSIILTSKVGGPDGNAIEYSASSSSSELQTSTAGAKLSGGQDAAKVAPGTLVSLLGENLSEETASVPPDAAVLPRELANVQVYLNGIRAPLLVVSPVEIRAQMPIEVSDTDSVNAYVRTVRKDGTITVTSAVAVPIVKQNPGVFAIENNPDPRPALAVHSSSHATGTISVDGTARAGDVATVIIEDREYSYTVQQCDTLASIRDALVERVNQDPKVAAYPASAFTRIRLRARVAGPEGNGIPIGGRSRDGDQVIMTATNSSLCCANVAGAPITPNNPAVPGETIIVYATGLGLVRPAEAREAQKTGEAYTGPVNNDPVEFVSSLAGGKTANVISAGLKPGTVGIYEVVLELNSDIPTNARTQLTIAQDVFVSNVVTFPVFNPNAGR